MTTLKRPCQPTDRLVTLSLVGHVAVIFLTDYLWDKYRRHTRVGTPRVTRLRPDPDAPATYSGNTRRCLPLKAFFWYLAVHMTWRLRGDPLVWLADQLRDRRVEPT